jgi:3,4-dihydroxy 2-butanone 4-phosphate synthase/GTP cyclohydrolase II
VHRDVHIALVQAARSAPTGSSLPLVRVHLADTLRDVLGVRSGARAWTLRDALKRIAREPSGVLVILREQESPRALADAVQFLDRRDPAPQEGQQSVLRTYGIGAQILKDLGVRRMRVLSAPKHCQGISAFDLEVRATWITTLPDAMPNYKVIDGALRRSA